MKTVLIIMFLFLLFGLSRGLTPPLLTNFGQRDYNDECEFIDMADPGQFVSYLDPYKYCDTNRGLHCMPGLGRCGCLFPMTIYRGGKCRAKVNNGCVVKDFKLECVEHAICGKNHSSLTWRCACERGYIPNFENTACFSRYEFDYRRRNSYYMNNSSITTEKNNLFLLMISLFIIVVTK